MNTITIGKLRKEREKDTQRKRNRGRENEESIKKIEERNFSFSLFKRKVRYIRWMLEGERECVSELERIRERESKRERVCVRE